MRFVLALALLLAPVSARADHLLFDFGASCPQGATIGLGVRGGGWRAVAEFGGAGGPFMGMLTGTLRLHRDIGEVRLVTLALGVEATRLGYMGGSDEVVFGSVDMVGPTVAVRRRASPRTDIWLEAGALAARCHTGCMVTLAIVPALAGRISVRF